MKSFFTFLKLFIIYFIIKIRGSSSDTGGDDGELELAPTVADCCPSRTLEIARAIRTRKESELVKLLGTAGQYWSNFAETESDRDSADRKPCIYAFSGAAYQGLQVSDCGAAAVSYLQKNLRIIDPLYGLLRPLDRIQPYRLEMASKNVLLGDQKKIKLADFWKDAITERLSQELQDRDPSPSSSSILLNLASDEYAAAVSEAGLPKATAFVKVVFWQEGRVISVHAKRARGLMARYLAEKEATTLDDVRAFAEEGYSFVASKSDEQTLVFDRPKPPPKKNAKSNATKKRAASSNSKSRNKKQKRSR